MTAVVRDDTLLGIYLNDHLAGAVATAALANRLTDAERHLAGGAVLARLATEVAEDRDALQELMAALDVAVRRYKGWADGWWRRSAGSSLMAVW